MEVVEEEEVEVPLQAVPERRRNSPLSCWEYLSHLLVLMGAQEEALGRCPVGAAGRGVAWAS